MYPTCPVIYRIVNKENNKSYVGQTINFRKRRSQHYNALSKGKHCSTYLQKSFNKNGENNYYIEILEEVNTENICEREIYWIEKLDSSNRDKGYNILVNSPSPWYGKRSETHCRRISEALTGKHPTEATKRKQSLARKGRFTGKESAAAKAVIQYDKNMNFIKEHVSVKEAAKSIGRCPGSVSECLVGRNKTSGGYIFKYKEVL